jgi:aminoglycoside phosphotransferase (APT) family kinase protein
VREWSAEIIVEERLARRLVGEQFPELGPRSIQLLGEGWDNTVWLVDNEWVFRFPRRATVVLGIQNEMELLPRLGPFLPLAIPIPTFLGQPSEAFRWPFYGSRFLPGRELADAELDDEARRSLARPLADFLRALHDVDLGADVPVDPVRRADMAVRVPRAREFLGQVETAGLWRPPPFVDEILDAAMTLSPPEATAVVHGDLHLRHLLVGDAGEPTAVIDWIDLCRNDPCVDLVLFWSVLPPSGREEFLESYGTLGDDQLLRGRVLALFLCAVLAIYAHDQGMTALGREAVAALERVCSDRDSHA